MNASDHLRFFLFLVRLQWHDRKVTSSFLIGITLQTAVLSFSIYESANSGAEAMILTVRSALFSVVNISMFAAMSNLNNEFKFGTIANLIVSPMHMTKLVLLRSVANTLITLPAILLPAVMTVARFPDLDLSRFALALTMLFMYLAALCFVSTFILNSVPNPSAMIPWLKYLLLLIGMSLIPSLDWIALVLPSAWVLLMVSEPHIFPQLLGFAISLVLLGGTTFAIFQRRFSDQLEQHLTRGKITL